MTRCHKLIIQLVYLKSTRGICVIKNVIVFFSKSFFYNGYLTVRTR